MNRAFDALTAAANALKLVDSPHHELRAQLHLELAKIDAGNDLLVSAQEHARAATSLEYQPACGRDAAHFRLARPLDRHLQPLLHSLDLRLDGCDASGGASDEAALHIEHARGSRSAGSRRDSLVQAIACLKRVPLVQPPAQPSTDAADVQRCQNARRLTALWGAVVKAAWSGRLHGLVHEAAPHVLAAQWDAGVDREMVALQVCALAKPTSETAPAHVRGCRRVLARLQGLAACRRLAATTRLKRQCWPSKSKARTFRSRWMLRARQTRLIESKACDLHHSPRQTSRRWCKWVFCKAWRWRARASSTGR